LRRSLLHRDTNVRAFGLLALLVLLPAFAMPRASLAQGAQQAPAQSMDSAQLIAAMTRYYERPSDIVLILTSWEKLGAPGPDAMMGFLAGHFAKYPYQIDQVTKPPFGKTAQLFIVQGLRLAGRLNDARVAAWHWNWPAEEYAKITDVTPLKQAKATGAQIFDVMWGASFATGDSTYVRPIYEFLSAFVSEPGVEVGDVVTMVAFRHRLVNQDAVKQMAGKYPKETFARIAHASSALWSLESNARQHKFVAAALEQYAKQQPQSLAIKAIDDVRKLRSR
jgi:hypothetical protein